MYRKGKEVVGLAPGMDKVLSKEPGALELEVGEGELLPEVDGEDLPKHEEGDPGDMEKWEELVGGGRGSELHHGRASGESARASAAGSLGENGGQVELPESPCPASSFG